MLLLLLSFFALAADPDNFSGRNTPPQNELINRYIQGQLQSVVTIHNSINKNNSVECNMEEIENLLVDSFDRNWPDVYSLNQVDAIDGPKSIDESVLNGQMRPLFYIRSFTLNLKGKNYSVGLDKLDHMFSHGYLYWKIVGKDTKMPKEKVIQALKLGVAQEQSAWGLKTSGVKSYGDLSANYMGMNFWRDIWDGSPAFFSCVKGKLVLQREFKIEDYLNGAVDEAINCSSYQSKKMADTVIGRTQALKRKCPIDKHECDELKKGFPKEYQEYLLHPLCLGKASNQVEVPSQLTVRDVLDGASALSDGSSNLLKTFFPGKTTKAFDFSPQPSSSGNR